MYYISVPNSECLMTSQCRSWRMPSLQQNEHAIMHKIRLQLLLVYEVIMAYFKLQ